MWTILRGNSLYLPLADESVQCVVTSPPYWGLRDYGTASWEGGDPDCAHEPNRDSPSSTLNGGKATQRQGYIFRDICPLCGAQRVDSQIGLEPTPELYVTHLVEVFREVWRVLRKDGTLWLNLGDSYASGMRSGYDDDRKYGGARSHDMRPPTPGYLKPKDLVGVPWRVAFALQADGWWLRNDIIWHKPNTMPESVRDRCTNCHEHLFLLAKSERYYYDAEAIKELSVDPEGSAARYQYPFSGRPGLVMPDGNEQRIAVKGMRDFFPKRNKRDVWTVATRPYKGAHFATFPPALVKPCILAGTSERGCCPTCDAPWERVVEKKLVPQYETRHGEYHAKGDARGMVDLSKSWKLGTNHVTTLSWRPTCGCPEHEPVPCTVLDPFGGAGTTVLVADRLGRVGVGVELSEDYCRMAHKGLYRDAPLFAYTEGAVI